MRPPEMERGKQQYPVWFGTDRVPKDPMDFSKGIGDWDRAFEGPGEGNFNCLALHRDGSGGESLKGGDPN